MAHVRDLLGSTLVTYAYKKLKQKPCPFRLTLQTFVGKKTQPLDQRGRQKVVNDLSP